MFLLCFVPELKPLLRPMKRTIPIYFIWCFVASLKFTPSFSQTSLQSINGDARNSSSLISYEAYDAPLKCTTYNRLKQTGIDGTVSHSEIKKVITTTSGIKLPTYPVPNTDNMINIGSVSDSKNHELQLLNAGGHILFSALLTKASVELPSLVTGVYFVRVKNKVSGGATNLPYVKI